MSVAQKFALVTGASGDLGLVITRRLVLSGYVVFAQFHRNTGALCALREALGPSLHPIQANLTNENGVNALIRSVAEHTDGLDLLVNNAGGARPTPLRNLDVGAWNDCLALNLTAPFLLARAAVDLLGARKGAIVNIASVAALSGGAFGPHYAAAKAGLIGLTRSLARELGPLGIRVNALAPGPLDSKMTQSLSDQERAALLAATALGRFASTDEVASAVLACSTQLGAMTGQLLVLDGGRIFH